MSIFTSRYVKRLFVALCCLCTALILSIQICLKLAVGKFSLITFLLTVLFSVAVLVAFRRYFFRQGQMLDTAAAQLDRFAAGDTSARIESDEEGGFARLFHSVNQMSTMLSAGAEHEQQEKLFLKNTISDISHQLKTPLAALEIYNSLLQDEKDNPAVVSEFASKSEKEIERIEILVQNLLKITRLDSGSIEMNLQTENVAELMREVKSHFDTRAEREKKQLVLLGAADAELLCDRVWLVEAVSNLVKNALDHTQENDEIELKWNKLPSAVQIIVKDNGSGIHQEDIYHLFKRFYRSRFSKDTQGLGLGLSLVKAIVEAHDGIIEVDSELGKGSTFTINFRSLTK